MALILSAAMMLDHLGAGAAADWVRAAVRRVIADGRPLTPDLGGTAGTTEVAEAVAGYVERSRRDASR